MGGLGLATPPVLLSAGFSWVGNAREGAIATSATWAEDLLTAPSAAPSAVVDPWVGVAGGTAQALTDRGGET